MGDLEALRQDLRRFVTERDWDQFHSPKDLALSLSVEAAELLELFQWRNPASADVRADPADLARVRAEVADVVLYALLMSDKLGFDLVEACREKLAANEAKYPAEKARGSAAKYTSYSPGP